MYETPVSPAETFLSPWCCPTVSARHTFCVPRGNSEVKVEWTLLCDPISNFMCGAQTIHNVHPRTVVSRKGPGSVDTPMVA